MNALEWTAIFLAVGVGLVLYFFFGSFLFGAGYEPTGRARVDALLDLAEVGPTDTVYELGAGTGAIAFRAAEQRGAHVVAIEIDPIRVAVLRLRRARSPARGRISIRRKNLFSADLRAATVVTTFLWPAAMTRLSAQLERDLSPGTRVISHYHRLTGWTPDTVDAEHRLYLYRVPPRPAASRPAQIG